MDKEKAQLPRGTEDPRPAEAGLRHSRPPLNNIRALYVVFPVSEFGYYAQYGKKVDFENGVQCLYASSEDSKRGVQREISEFVHLKVEENA